MGGDDLQAREIEKCIDLFGTDIYRFCIKLCADKTDAEDLYQQTFLKALESNFEIDWERNPKALFFSLSYNLWKSDVRKKARRAAIAPCSNIEQENENMLHSSENMEENYLKKALLEETNKIIETLPEKFRVPLTLHYLFGLSIEQVAETVKRPPGTIKSRLFKGRNLIKKRLEEAGYDK